MGTGGVLFLVPTKKCKNTSAICLSTCGCDMNFITVIVEDSPDGCTGVLVFSASGVLLGVKESPG